MGFSEPKQSVVTPKMIMLLFSKTFFFPQRICLEVIEVRYFYPVEILPHTTISLHFLGNFPFLCLSTLSMFSFFLFWGGGGEGERERES